VVSFDDFKHQRAGYSRAAFACEDTIVPAPSSRWLALFVSGGGAQFQRGEHWPGAEISSFGAFDGFHATSVILPMSTGGLDQ